MLERNRAMDAGPPGDVRPVSRLPLWIGFLGGPTIWSIHLLASEFVLSAACSTGTPGFESFTFLGTAGWRIVLLLLTGALALLALGADIIAVRAWRETRIGTRLTGEAEGAAGRSGWMSLAGVLLSTLFLVGILLAGLPLFWLGGCG
jgi:hypothetical protein